AMLDALPVPRAVKILEQPELRDASELVAALPPQRAALLLGQMADDRATDIFHELDEAERDLAFFRQNPGAQLSPARY
ncbi:hypothetical protein SB658_24495, partial [Bacillus sp. SIMBA_008]|uniref:magnesium transporter MgtE N-terminal domain-containing protein n=1 Tax=Bacillus sp. SIMBA_008 TaxID=3085757 RepID=UPI003978F135